MRAYTPEWAQYNYRTYSVSLLRLKSTCFVFTRLWANRKSVFFSFYKIGSWKNNHRKVKLGFVRNNCISFRILQYDLSFCSLVSGFNCNNTLLGITEALCHHSRTGAYKCAAGNYTCFIIVKGRCITLSRSGNGFYQSFLFHGLRHEALRCM